MRRHALLVLLLIIGSGGVGCWPSPAGPDREDGGEEQEPDDGGPDNFSPIGFSQGPVLDQVGENGVEITFDQVPVPG